MTTLSAAAGFAPSSEVTIPAIAVIGLGNLLMSDDGVGPRVCGELSKVMSDADVEYIDGGVCGLSLLEWIEGREQVIIIDAARMGWQPGDVVRFQPSDVREAIERPDAGRITHATGVLDVLRFGVALGSLPPVTFYGVEPESAEPGTELTAAGRRALSSAVELVRVHIDELITRMRVSRAEV
jgi:hydrogenase maturation protease